MKKSVGRKTGTTKKKAGPTGLSSKDLQAAAGGTGSAASSVEFYRPGYDGPDNLGTSGKRPAGTPSLFQALFKEPLRISGPTNGRKINNGNDKTAWDKPDKTPIHTQFSTKPK
jgi:hypothetical protein